MRNVPLTLFLVAAVALIGGISSGCGDDPQSPGDLIVNWSHGALSSTTCGSRSVTTVEARALQGGKVIASQSVACPAGANKGAITIAALKPGNYNVEVEAFDADDRGTYLAVMDGRIGVKEGKEVETAELRLTEKPVNLTVQWTPPGTGNCAGNNVRTVEVELYINATTSAELLDSMPAACAEEFTDDEGNLEAGVQFESIEPNDNTVIVVYGLDQAKARIARGEVGPFALLPGDNGTRVVPLETCPGTPPVCQ